jgi:hypothetical protein
MNSFKGHFLSVLTLCLIADLNLLGQNQYHVYFFLLEDCKISQAYIPEIRKFKAEFESDSMEFKAFFPSPSSEEKLVKEFVEEYQPELTCVVDDHQAMAKKFDIRVMPEVVVYKENEDKVLYQGRIDNLFAGLGKRRAKATTHELKDCLLKIQKSQPIQAKKTEAIGCYLTRL